MRITILADPSLAKSAFQIPEMEEPEERPYGWKEEKKHPEGWKEQTGWSHDEDELMRLYDDHPAGRLESWG